MMKSLTITGSQIEIGDTILFYYGDDDGNDAVDRLLVLSKVTIGDEIRVRTSRSGQITYFIDEEVTVERTR